MIATSLPGGGAPRTVAFLASTLAAGPAEGVLHDLVRGLDRRKWCPVVFTLKARGDLGDRIASDGVEVREGFLRRRFDPGVVLRLARAFRAEGTAVLYTLEHEDAMLWGRLAARLAGVRASVTGLSSIRGGRPGLRRWNRWTLPLADRLLCAARGQADLLVGEEGADPARLVVIHSAVDTEEFRPGAEDVEFRRGIGVPPEAPLAGVLSPLEPENALDLFLRAAVFARARVPAARFLLVGDGPTRPWLEAQAEQFGLAESVRFLGARTDVARVLRSLRVSVLASHSLVEAFPLSQLEAMATGVAVVSTDVGSLRELVADGETGLLVPPGDARSLGETMARLLLDGALARRLGAAGRDRVVRLFSVERMVKAHEDLFEDLLRERAPSRNGRG